MMSLSERRKVAMKDGIYDAAVAVLTREGLDSATMDRIAEEAGIAKGSLYNYFRNKTDLLEFVYRKAVDAIENEVAGVVETDASAADKLREIFRVAFEYLSVRRGLFNFLFDQHTFHKLTRKPSPLAHRNLVRVLQQGMDEGVFRQIDPAFHATLIFGAMRGLCDQFLEEEEPWPIDEMVEAMFGFCTVGLMRDFR